MSRFIPIANPDLTGNEKKYLGECIDTGWVSYKGQFVKKFEEEFAKYVEAKYAIACSSGTAGLHLALLALGVGVGDEVIVPTLTFIATVNAVKYVGAEPVFADSDSETWNIDLDKIESLITKKTKAIIPVHLYGHPVDMGKLKKIARKHKIAILEDAAEAHGAEYKGKKVGAIGEVGIFSLFGNKTITSGEGGVVVTNSQAIATKVRLYKDQGLTPKQREKYYYKHNVIGYNYGMSNLQAAVALAQLERIEEFIKSKRKIAQLYVEKLKDLGKLDLSIEKPWARNVYWMFSGVLKDNVKLSRDKFMSLLKAEGVDSRPFFYPIHTLPPYHIPTKFKVAERLGKRGFNLPSYSKLTEEDINFVTNCIKKILKKY